MSLQFFDGFQDCDVMPKPEWAIASPWTAAAGRDGTLASSYASNSGSQTKTLNLPSPAATCIAGLAWYATATGNFTNTGVDNYILGFIRSGVVECVVTQNASGMLELRRTSRTGTLLATSSGHAPMTITQWNHIQAKATLKSDGTGNVEVRLNGAAVINFTGQTAGTSGDVTQLILGGSATGTRFDDFWVCDAVDATATQGAPNNSFLGDLKVSSLVPAAAGDNSGFTPSTGVTNWSLVDEVPVNTTDYVSTAVSATRDLYQLSDLPAGVAAPVAVRIGLYAQKSDAGASSIKPLIKENTVLTTGSTAPLLTTWSGFWGALRTKKPSADTPWTVADVNGMQIGVELA